MMETKDKIKLTRQVITISGIFCAFIALLLLLNFWHMHQNKPLESLALQALVDRLAEDPGNDALKQEIRNFDLMARKAYFTSVWQVKTGAYILICGMIIFAVALWYRQKLLSRIEKPNLTVKSEVAERIISQKWLLVSGGVIMILALSATFFTSDYLSLYNPAQETPAPSSNVEQVNIVPLAQKDSVVQQSDSSKTLVTASVVTTAGSPVVEQTNVSEPLKTAAPVALTTDVIRKQHNSFRGPFGLGISYRKNIPVEWDGASGKNVIWKTPIDKPGYNSPVIWDDRIFLSGGDEQSRVVYCLDRNTGKLIWQKEASGIPGSPSKMPDVTEDTGLAAPSVTTDGNGVYAIFGTGDIIAFDMDGNRLWAKNMGVPDNHYGHSSSLIIWDGKLIVQYDTNKSGRLIAFNPRNGEPVWDVRRTSKISWSSPVIAQIEGKYQVITTSVPFVAGHDLATGAELWNVDVMMGEIGPSAGFSDGIVYAANEYAELVAIQPGNPAKVLWQDNEFLPEASSVVASDGVLYLATSYGVIACYDTQTGKRLWDHEGGKGFFSSPVIADGKMYVIDMGGKMYIFKTGKEKVLLGEPSLGEKGFATPAFTDGRIYLRGDKSLFCIGNK